MTNDDFEKLFDAAVKAERELMITKAADYAGGGDRLWNFRSGAGITGLTPAQTLWGYLSKHLASIRDIARGRKVTRETLREKCGDARNYILLLEALVLTQGMKDA